MRLAGRPGEATIYCVSQHRDAMESGACEIESGLALVCGAGCALAGGIHGPPGKDQSLRQVWERVDGVRALLFSRDQMRTFALVCHPMGVFANPIVLP
jgi:hypothetical protein